MSNVFNIQLYDIGWAILVDNLSQIATHDFLTLIRFSLSTHRAWNGKK